MPAITTSSTASRQVAAIARLARGRGAGFGFIARGTSCSGSGSTCCRLVRSPGRAVVRDRGVPRPGPVLACRERGV
ncbi:hypothetical protein GCM10025789_12400 [Tessaracoccus lubricantis]|uniref:Uncharacterized protein n=1 Tax=Tessaracoccus lubricantis TaxID=545543 RepID=A0ABP9F945_9ACTN